jgi:hypothetical protein
VSIPWAATKEYKGNEAAADQPVMDASSSAPSGSRRGFRYHHWLAGMDEGGTKMSKSVWSNFDPLSILVIVLTLVLFVLALFANGFTHDLLQECGVFLVSVKLIMMSHKNGVSARLAEERLEKIQNLLQTTREQSA